MIGGMSVITTLKMGGDMSVIKNIESDKCTYEAIGNISVIKHKKCYVACQ